jgi:hypothetical protein
MSSLPRPVVLELCLGGNPDLVDAVHGRLLTKIAERSDFKRAKSPVEALQLLEEHRTPQAIIVTDQGLLNQPNQTLSRRVVEYVRNGGRVVLGACFSSLVRPKDLDRYFGQVWDLPWRMSSYHRTTVSLNREARQLPGGSIPSSYSQKAVSLKGVEKYAAWYLPTATSTVESMVFSPQPISNLLETPVAFIDVGEGWLGYIGDVNGEEGTDSLLLGMAGLL